METLSVFKRLDEKKITIFDVDNFSSLWSELEASMKDPSKRKGFLLEWSIAFELSLPSSQSSFLKYICFDLNKSEYTYITKLQENEETSFYPHPISDSKILFFSSDNQIINDRVCIVQESRESKISDVAGPRLIDNYNRYWNLKFEMKNAESDRYLKQGYDTFQKKYINYPTGGENHILFYVTTKKLEKIIDDIFNKPFTIDLNYFAKVPKAHVRFNDLIAKLPPCDNLTTLKLQLIGENTDIINMFSTAQQVQTWFKNGKFADVAEYFEGRDGSTLLGLKKEIFFEYLEKRCGIDFLTIGDLWSVLHS